MDIEWLTFDVFSGRIGETFAMSVGEGETLSLELIDATESTEQGGRGPQGQERLQFSLIFRGPTEPLMPQAIYPLAQGELKVEVFLVPVGLDSEGARYQAIFA